MKHSVYCDETDHCVSGPYQASSHEDGELRTYQQTRARQYSDPRPRLPSRRITPQARVSSTVTEKTILFVTLTEACNELTGLIRPITLKQHAAPIEEMPQRWQTNAGSSLALSPLEL